MYTMYPYAFSTSQVQSTKKAQTCTVNGTRTLWKTKQFANVKKYMQTPSDMHLQCVNKGTKARAVVFYSATNVSKDGLAQIT